MVFWGAMKGLGSKGTWHPTWRSKFQSWDQHSRNKEPAPVGCPLTPAHTGVHMYTNVWKPGSSEILNTITGSQFFFPYELLKSRKGMQMTNIHSLSFCSFYRVTCWEAVRELGLLDVGYIQCLRGWAAEQELWWSCWWVLGIFLPGCCYGN